MERPKVIRKRVRGRPKPERHSGKPKVICLAEAFGPTVVGLGFRKHELEQGAPSYHFDRFMQIEEHREQLLKEIGCDDAFVSEGASLLRQAVRALEDCEELYCALEMTIDQSPKLEPIHSLEKHMERFRERVKVTQNELQRLLENNVALAYADEFKFEEDPAETSGDETIILYGPLLRSLGHRLRALSEYLEPIALRLATVPRGPDRGRPRKYSLGFAIMRLAQIYHQFGAEHPEPAVSLTMLPTVKYSGPFFRFAEAFFSSVEGRRKAKSDQAFGRTVQDVLKVWNRDRNLHLLITSHAQTKDVVNFVKGYDQIRADLGLVQAT